METSPQRGEDRALLLQPLLAHRGHHRGPSTPTWTAEPNPADELDAGAVVMLRTAVAERSEAERHLFEAVRAAREAGMSWSAIGSLVGTTGEAARQRYGGKVT